MNDRHIEQLKVLKEKVKHIDESLMDLRNTIDDFISENEKDCKINYKLQNLCLESGFVVLKNESLYEMYRGCNSEGERQLMDKFKTEEEAVSYLKGYITADD